jgi:lipoate-protein ligase A
MVQPPASPSSPILPVAAGPAPLRWWLMPTITADGAWQMACDSWLLQRAVEGCREPVLRFYRWSRPCLSLGFHQRHRDLRWQALVDAGRIDLVRRPSGGRAVLHAGCLTYALIWPDAPANRLDTYASACGWLQAGFAALGLPLHFGAERLPRPGRPAAGGDGPPASCFALGSAADLCHANGAKRIGSAQLRRQGQLLQHGTILVDPPASLWREIFGADPPPLPALEISMDALERHLAAAAVAHLSALFTPSGCPPVSLPPRRTPLSGGDRAAIAALRRVSSLDVPAPERS